MMAAQRKVFLLTIMCGFFAHIGFATPPAFSNLIVFGDSLSDAASLSTETNLVKERDVGNNFWVVLQGKTGAPVTSKDNVTQLRPLWSNDLMMKADIIGLNPNQTHYIYPIRQIRRLGYSPLGYSVSYAWASAETNGHYVNDMLSKKLQKGYLYNDKNCKKNGPGEIGPDNTCVPGVLLQVNQYLDDVNGHPNPHSLIIIWAGANDVINNIARIEQKDGHKNKFILMAKLLFAAYPVPGVSGTEELSHPIRNLKLAVTRLLQAGVPATNIYVIGLPDLAKTPQAISIEKQQKTLYYLFSALTDVFNTMLHIELTFNYLHAQYNLPHSHILSSNHLLYEMTKHPHIYGFDKVTQDCVTNGAEPYCQGYVFFNNIHPSMRVHQYIADYIANILTTGKSASLRSE